MPRGSSLIECPLNARLETGVDLSFFLYYEGGDGEAAPRAAQQAAQRAEEHVSPSECWLELMQDKSVRSGVSEYAKLAEIALVMVPGSVEDERRFSALTFRKSKVRNRLLAHLGQVMRMF